MTTPLSTIPIRDGYPTQCVVCGQPLHRKSEYYCSQRCAEAYATACGQDAPPFLSKWKLRKRKEQRDPFITIRQKTRKKTRDLIRQGRLVRQPCLVCGNPDTLPHHEDYANPFEVLWLCPSHHEAYHQGVITLCQGRLRWSPDKLIPSLHQRGKQDKYGKRQ